MALVAKRYQEWKQVGAIHKVDGKDHITVMNDEEIKLVRVYTQKQYDFLSGMAYQQELDRKAKSEIAMSFNEERKVNAGFEDGYIIAVLGDTYEHRQELKDLGATFSSEFKWFFFGGLINPKSQLLSKFDTRILKWSDVSEELENGVIRLKPTNELKKLLRLDNIDDSDSEFQGEEGILIEMYGYVKKAMVIDGEKGRHCMHIILDIKDNVYIWNSSIAEMLDEKLYRMEVAVSHHSEYNGVEQTMLSSVEII